MIYILTFRFPVKSVNVRGEDILVMDDVVVKSPYQLENCVPIDPEHPNIQGLNQVKKVVRRPDIFFMQSWTCLNVQNFQVFVDNNNIRVLK